MAIVRVFLFLIFITIVIALFAKYILLVLWKIFFIEKKLFKKIIKKSKIEKDIRKK